MNASEAKSILLLYRPGTSDAEDPQVAEALALTQSNPELAEWFAVQQAQQEALRAKFKQVAPPAGLIEQIISEHAAARRAKTARSRVLVSLVVILALLGFGEAYFYLRPAPRPEPTLENYQAQMRLVALVGYTMDLPTNNLDAVHSYLAQHHAPADFTIPQPLQHTTVTGCSLASFNGQTVALVCYRTSRAQPDTLRGNSDLWLFVVDRNAVVNLPDLAKTQIGNADHLATATWTDGQRVYFLAISGTEEELKNYL